MSSAFPTGSVFHSDQYAIAFSMVAEVLGSCLVEIGSFALTDINSPKASSDQVGVSLVVNPVEGHFF